MERVKDFITASWESLLNNWVPLFDQALFTGTNFIITILLARWLPQEQYGAFSTIYNIFLLFGSVHTAMLGEPIMVFGSRHSGANIREYASVFGLIQFFITVIFSLLVIIAYLFLHNQSQLIAINLMGLALALPFILSQWFYRRFFYSQTQPHKAAWGSAIYLCVMLALLLTFRYTNHLTINSVWLLQGISGCVVVAYSLQIIKPKLQTSSLSSIKLIFQEIKAYSGWNLLATGLYWFSGQVIFLIVPIMLNLNSSANIAAAQNFYRPLHPLMQSITLLMLPSLARKYQSLSRQIIDKKFWSFSGIFAGGVLLYGVLVTLFSNNLTSLVYQDKYINIQPLILFFGFSYFSQAVISMVIIVYKAINRVSKTVVIWGTTSIVTLISIIPLIRWGGESGAIITLAFSYFVGALLAIMQLKKFLNMGNTGQ